MDQDSPKLLKGRTLRVRDAVKDVVRDELHIVMNLEREVFLREHGGRKNGSYPRVLETPYGEVDLRVPRDRVGQFRTAVFPPYARRTPDLSDLVVSRYAVGVSDRKISDVLSLLLGHRYSHQTISQITELVMDRVEAFRNRPLEERYAIVFIDALFLKVFREGGGIEQEALYVALGVTPAGYRRVLGFWLYPTESSLVWEELLKELTRRGVREVLCFVSDPASPSFDLPGTCASHQTNLPSSGLAAVHGSQGQEQ